MQSNVTKKIRKTFGNIDYLKNKKFLTPSFLYKIKKKYSFINIQVHRCYKVLHGYFSYIYLLSSSSRKSNVSSMSFSLGDFFWLAP